MSAPPPEAGRRSRERTRLMAMMGLYFLVLVSVGILRPIKNALALDGLAEGDFYQVYLVSAAVVLFAPAFNNLADRIAWQKLIPATAAFFVLNLLIFRAVYTEGSTLLGMVFYGWYDLFAAVLVTQFFMAVQVMFNARDAKSAVPLVIAAGSLGVVFGGVITGLFARSVGTPNLLLVAAVFVATFAATLPVLWKGFATEAPTSKKAGARAPAGGLAGTVRDFREVFSNRHIRLIAGLVLATVVVKQVVDYEFNEASRLFMEGDRDAISSFQGYVFGVKDALPLLVLLPLGPLLRRYGVGLAVMMLPVAMLGFTGALAVAFSVWTATVAKAGDSMFRYSAERTAREVLYVPVPTELKLRAKTYVDVAIEKGFGKALTGGLIFALTTFMAYRSVTWLAVGMAVVWCFMALAAKREYVTTLAESIRGRFANLGGGFATLTERSTLALVEEALRGDSVQVGFGLELVEQAGSVDAKHLADELELLLDHPDEQVRVRVLGLLARFPDLVGEGPIRARLADGSERVGEAAVGALEAKAPDEARRESVLAELLFSPDDATRLATLWWLVNQEGDRTLTARLGSTRVAELLPGSLSEEAASGSLEDLRPAARRELALTCGLLKPGPFATRLLMGLLEDDDEGVVGAAVRSVAGSGSSELHRHLVDLLSDPARRGRAREALVAAGGDVVDLCAEALRDPAAEASIRVSIPRVLARIPGQPAVDALVATAAARDSGWNVRYQAIKALNKLRTRNGAGLVFEREAVLYCIDIELEEAGAFAGLFNALRTSDGDRTPAGNLLQAVALEAWEDRREAVFRLLGLVYAPDEVYRSHSTLGRSDERARANALEWLERTLGHTLFTRVAPVLEGTPSTGRDAPPAVEDVLRELADASDPWLSELAARSLEDGGRPVEEARESLDLIEKVFLLQKVDLLQGARPSHLRLLATIAEEVEADPGEELIRSGEVNESLFVIVRGSVELSGVGDQTITAGADTPFGTWSLIDSAPSIVGARVLERSRLVRITRSDFQELVADHPEVATGMLQGLARRVRSLIA